MIEAKYLVVWTKPDFPAEAVRVVRELLLCDFVRASRQEDGAMKIIDLDIPDTAEMREAIKAVRALGMSVVGHYTNRELERVLRAAQPYFCEQLREALLEARGWVQDDVNLDHRHRGQDVLDRIDAALGATAAMSATMA